MLRCCSFALALTSHDLRTTLPIYRISTSTTALHMSSSAGNADSSDTTTPTSYMYAQHIVLRGDLLDTWGTGPMITQGAHVSVAAIETYRKRRHIFKNSTACARLPGRPRMRHGWKRSPRVWTTPMWNTRYGLSSRRTSRWAWQPDRF